LLRSSGIQIVYIYTCCPVFQHNPGGAVLTVEKGAIVSDTQKIPPLEEIELRAYEIYSKRGDADGVALEDWLAAEKELLASRQQSS
jgi:hypothetical protein